MRHKKKGRYLNRTSSHYRAMFNNMICSLLKYEIIKTTVSKAKELRSIIEPLINRAKINSVANQRLVFSYIKDKSILLKLFNDIGPYFLDRSGGYTKILKCGFRLGDRSKIAYIKLVDRFNKK